MLTRLTLAALMTATPILADEVNIYSYRQPELLAPLTAAFEAETGITVNVAYMKKGMVERLSAEGKRSPADLVFTVDMARLAAIVDAGLTQPVQSAALSAHIPAAFHDPDGHWWGLTSRARVVYASRDRVADSDITTYEALTDPKWKGRVCMRSGTHPYNVALTAAYLHHHGADATRAWLTGLKANLARKPQGNDRAQIKAIWAGECDISIGNTYYMGAMLKNEEQKAWAADVRLLFPTFENGGAHVNISGVAMTRAAPNHDNAVKLMEFLASPKAQQIYAEANFEYPISPDVAPDPLVASWGSFTPDDANLMDIARLRSAALKLIEEVDFDG